jgi:pimeloyl-ACP methyl ester carboxylesterase
MTTFQHATVRPQALLSRGRLNGFSTIVLLHGFPSSSHMFRDLIPTRATCPSEGDTRENAGSTVNDVSKPTYFLSRDQVM